MKRIVGLLLVVVLVLSLGACGGDAKKDESTSEAYKLYQAADKKITDADKYAINMGMTMSLKSTTQVTDMTMAANVKEVADGLEFNIDAQNGETDKLEQTYYKDGVAYTIAGETKTQAKAEKEDVMGVVLPPTFEVADIKKDSVKDAEGGQTLTFTLKADTFSDYAKTLIDNMGLEQEVSKVKDTKMTVLIGEEGDFISIDMTFTVELKGEDAGSIDVTIRHNGFSTSDVTVEFPEDLDSYSAAE